MRLNEAYKRPSAPFLDAVAARCEKPRGRPAATNAGRGGELWAWRLEVSERLSALGVGVSSTPGTGGCALRLREDYGMGRPLYDVL